MSWVPYYGRGYYTTQMKTEQSDVTTCKLPIPLSVEKVIKDSLQREHTSCKCMLHVVIDHLLTQPKEEWRSFLFETNHLWIIAASKEVMWEFRKVCNNAGMDWKGVLSYGMLDYLERHHRLNLFDETNCDP